MKLAATLVLALSLPSNALGAPKVKPRPSTAAATPAATAVATAAVARIAERNIPKLVKYAKSKPGGLGPVMPDAAAKVNPAVPKDTKPPALTEPVLTNEELAVEVVELTPQSLHSPQVGTAMAGSIETFGRMVGMWLWPGAAMVSFGASAQWVSEHSLLVECAGMFEESQYIRLWRTKASTNKWDLVGSLTIDHAGDTLAFVVPSTSLPGWDRLVMTISDADATGYPARMDKCTFTRI